jgi:hypothetical protein
LHQESREDKLRTERSSSVSPSGNWEWAAAVKMARLADSDADNDDERIVVVGLEEAATKQEGGDEEEDQDREPTGPWPGSYFLLYLFYINAWLARIVV